MTPPETIEERELFGSFDARTFEAFDAAEYPERSPDDRTLSARDQHGGARESPWSISVGACQ